MKLFETITWGITAVTNASECIGKLLNKPGNAVWNFWYPTNMVNVIPILSILFFKMQLYTPKKMIQSLLPCKTRYAQGMVQVSSNSVGVYWRYFNLKFWNNLFFKRYQWKLFETITWRNTAVTHASECIGKLLNKPRNAVLNFWYPTNMVNVKPILSFLFFKMQLYTPKENDSITFAL